MKAFIVAIIATLSLGSTAHAGGPNRFDWNGLSINKAQVNNVGQINSPTFNASVNGGAANAATGASAAASFTTLSGRVPNLGSTSVSLLGFNNAQVNNVGQINNPTAKITYGVSFVNSAAGSSVGFSQSSAASGFPR